MEQIYRFFVPAPPQRVGQILCSEAFNVEADKDRPEVVNSRYLLLEQTDEQCVFQLKTEEYKRSKMGMIDRSGTTFSTTTNRWNASQGTLSWTYEGEGGSQYVKISGTYYLKPEGQGTRIEHRVNIEVNIPLIGGQIAKLVAKEFTSAADRFEALLIRHFKQEGTNN
jgi:carbon monoxide dehydrogenase subunit G